MNFSLLDKIESVDRGFIATVLKSEGHTYGKPGAKALFRAGEAFALHGNLGALCADQEIVDRGAEALRDGLPRVVRVDTTAAGDADLGYGTACGGVMEVLVEPVLAAHREVYRGVRARMERGERCVVVHDVTTGRVAIHESAPTPALAHYVEVVEAPQRVYLFGATPLALRIAHVLDDSDFDAHIVDWRRASLDHCTGIDARRLHLDTAPLEPRSYVVVLSHSFRRDQAAVAAALAQRCAFIGLLSSRPRRDRMFAELSRAGVAASDLERVSSPVGIDIGGCTDADIAVSVVAELMRTRNA